MRTITRNIDLSVPYSDRIELKQGDSATLILAIYNRGVAFTLTGYTAVLNALLSNDTSVVQATGITLSASSLAAVLDAHMYAVAGDIELELQLFYGNDLISSYVMDSTVTAQLLNGEASATTLPDKLYLATRAPYVGENGNWWVYDDDTGVFIDTGQAAVNPTQIAASIAEAKGHADNAKTSEDAAAGSATAAAASAAEAESFADSIYYNLIAPPLSALNEAVILNCGTPATLPTT